LYQKNLLPKQFGTKINYYQDNLDLQDPGKYGENLQIWSKAENPVNKFIGFLERIYSL
jgi:hypothetical protein